MSWNCIYGGCSELVAPVSMLYCQTHGYVRWEQDHGDRAATPSPLPTTRRATKPEPPRSPEYEELKARELAKIREKRS